MVGGIQYAVNALQHLFAICDEGDEDEDRLMFSYCISFAF